MTLSIPRGTAESIRSDYIESCFPHDRMACSLTDSQKLKENVLAAYAEVDRIDWNLGDTPSEWDLERLFLIDDFNMALANCIVKKLTLWAVRKDAPLQFSTGPREDYAHNMTLAKFAKDRDFEENYQIRELAPFCEQLSQKIGNVFQRKPLIPYQSQLHPRIKDLRSQVPEGARGFFTWIPAKISAPMPKPPTADSTTASLPSVSLIPTSSSSSTPVDAPKTPTARIAVAYDAQEGDKLFVRTSLDWTKGVEMEFKEGMWVFETTEPFEQLEYKIVLNDNQYEKGPNRIASQSQGDEITSLRF